MGEINDRHRPLMAGIKIASSENRGTLTGLATRDSDGKRVLVTNLHIVKLSWLRPNGSEEVYQLDVSNPNRVGRLLSWVDVDPEGDNIADVAVCKLLPGVDAEFALHNHPDHDMRAVVAGVKEPMKGMELTMLGSTNGEGTVTVKEVNQRRLVDGVCFTGVTILDSSQRPTLGGDSGSPCLWKEDVRRYRMSCIVFAAVNGNPNEGWAFPASVAERELGITFGYQSEITTRSEENMGIPILTSEGFVGQRWIVDDYFRAGETLHAGDAVAIKQQPDPPHLPRVFKIDVNIDVKRVIGVVQTPAGKEVGDPVAEAGELVPIVVQGLAQVLSARAIGVGDPVTPSANSGPPPGKTHQVARVGVVTTNYDAFIGRCLSVTPWPNQVADILVDIAGGYGNALPAVTVPARKAFNAPTNLQVVATSIGGQLSVTWTAPSGFDRTKDYYQVQYRENDDTAAWRPTVALQRSLPNATIAPLPEVVHQVRVRAVYNDPEGTNAAVSGWVTASGTPANNLPVANAGLDRTADTGVKVILQGSGTDLDGDTLTYSWEQLEPASPKVTLSSASAARPTFTAPATPTTLKFRLTVTDTHKAKGTDEMTVTVKTLAPASSDATLSALVITPSSVTLVPAFAGATTAYTASVGNAVASVQVTPTVHQASATVTVNGAAVTSGKESASINLAVGINSIPIAVTAPDGTTRKTYTVAVTRADDLKITDLHLLARTATSLTVAWSIPDDADRFLVQANPAPSFSLSSWTTLRRVGTYTFNGLKSDTEYLLRVAAQQDSPREYRIAAIKATTASATPVTPTVSLDFSRLPGHRIPLTFPLSSGSPVTLTDFEGNDLRAVSVWTAADTKTQRDFLGIQGQAIPNITDVAYDDTPFFQLYVYREGTLSRKIGLRLHSSPVILNSWRPNASFDLHVEFQSPGGPWQAVFVENELKVLTSLFNSASAAEPPYQLRQVAAVQANYSLFSSSQYDELRRFFTTEALSHYNVRIRVARH